MTNYATKGIASLTVIGLVVLLSFFSTTLTGQTQDKKPDNLTRSTELKSTAGLGEQAEQAENEGEFDTALLHYTELKKNRPKWAAVQFKIAHCQAALDKKEEAANTLREVLKIKFASPELVSQARAALQELVLPTLSDDQRKNWKQALALIQAGDEFKQRESEDLEIRIEHKLFYEPYHQAIILLENLTENNFDYAPAYVSLGLAYENLSNFKQAAHRYRKFLDFGSKHKLPELEQQALIRQRMLVCERRYQVDAELAKRIPGVWQASSANGEGAINYWKFTLIEGGQALREEKSGDKINWKLDKSMFWKVIGKQLIIGNGDDGKPGEWYDSGRLAPSGDSFEGVNVQLVPVRWVKLSQ